MREVKIVIEPFKFISFMEIECIKTLNEHGKIKIKGVISQDNIKEYQLVGEERWISIVLEDEDGVKETFFYGVLTNVEIEKTGQVNVMELTAYTGSYLLDLVPHIRSFQKDTYSYQEIILNCLKLEKGNCIILEKKDEKINRFLMQYEETEWKFFKRLAAYANTIIMPEYIAPGKNLYFGNRVNTRRELIDTGSFRVIQRYKKDKNQKNADVLLEVEINSREIYSLGEIVIFKNQEWVIRKIISYLRGQELYHVYFLCIKGQEKAVEDLNHLAGVSLKANVINVEKTKVQISIQKDENKDLTGTRWFDFATVYSSPDGTGWYCMPEIGDEVRLTFPDDNLENAYVASCVHLESSERNNPEKKSWKNKQGKEILFTPEKLVLTNNQGMFIELSDGEGIKIVSDKKIIIQADKEIIMDSKSGGIHAFASGDVTLNQGNACIKMNDSINISGGKIYMN